MTLQLPDSETLTCDDARIAATRRRVDTLAKRNLISERHHGERIVGTVH